MKKGAIGGNFPHTANIGGIITFTYEGAAKAYMAMAKSANDFAEYGAEGIYSLINEAEKMKKIGFTPEELEILEIQALR